MPLTNNNIAASLTENQSHDFDGRSELIFSTSVSRIYKVSSQVIISGAACCVLGPSVTCFSVNTTTNKVPLASSSLLDAD